MIGTSNGAMVVVLLSVAGALLTLPQGTRLARPEPAGSARPRQLDQAVRRAAVLGIGLGGAGLLLVPGLWWAVLPVAVAVPVILVRRPGRRSAAGRAADRRVVAIHAGLFASCLDAGMAVAPALRAASDALAAGRAPDDAGPLGTLDAVAAMLALGASPDTAWRAADLDDDLAPLASAARRSAAGGGALADAVREHAAQLRQESAAAAVRQAGRAGVLMTAPLGVCFLPAFLCLGLAPVVIGLLGRLDTF